MVAPGPDPAAWGPVLAEALGLTAETPVEALAHHAGPGAHRMDTPEGPLVVRVARERSQLERESAAIAAVTAEGLGAPEVVALVDLPGSPGGAAGALVTSPLPGMAFPDLMGFNLTVSDVLMTGFTRHHAAIHDVPTDGLDASVPTLSLDDELARIDAGRFGEHLGWLHDNRPDPGPPALCHGGYQPLCVAGPGKDDWDAHGGPGTGLAVGNWCGAFLAEREADVAFTLVAFWVAPHFAASRSERTAVKMIRPALANGYRKDYAAAAGLDQERLRYWQAFHAVRGMARLAGAYAGEGSPFEFTDRGPLPSVVAAELERFYRMQQRNG